MLKVNKQSNKETETQKHKRRSKQRYIIYERNKETKVEKLILGFLGTSMFAHT